MLLHSQNHSRSIVISCKTRLAKTVALACLSVSMFPSKVEAVNTSWTAGTADWNTGANWNTGNVPTNADVVFINNGGTAQVQSADAEASNVRIGASTGATGNLVISNGFELVSDSGVLGIGGGSNGMATVTGVGSSWDVGLGNIAVGTDGGNGTLDVLAGASLPGGNSLRIGLGPGGNGLLTIDGAGTSVDFATMQIGVSGATGTANLTGNSLTILDGGVGTLTIGSGTLNIGSGGTAGILNAGTVNGTTGTSILNFNHTDAGYFFTKDGTGGGGAINITGSLAVNHLGTGTTTLTGNNTYTDGTTISAGTLRAGAAGAFVSDSSYTVNGGTLDLNDFDLTMTSLSGTGGAVDLGTADLTVNQSSSTSYAGGITGTGTLTKDGAGTLTLTGTNTYSGGTTIDAGTLRINGDDRLGSGTVTLNGGILSLVSGVTTLTNNIQVNATGGTLLEGFIAPEVTGNITLDGNLLVDGASVFTLEGDISGTGSLTSDMTSGLIILGDATHTGGTTINTGVLQIGHNGTIGSISGNISSNTLVSFNRTDNLTYAGVISGTGTVNKIGAGTLTLSGDHTYSGDTAIAAGTLEFTGSTAGLGGNITNDSALIFNQAANSSYAGVISSTGTLTKDGTGTLTLTGSNTYTGATTISDGELVFDGGANTIGSITAAGGDLRIENGAVVNNDTGFIGRVGIGSAVATITGAGSTWNTTGDLAVSEYLSTPISGSGGTLRVENGGQVNAGGELYLDFAGVLEIDSSSQVTATNDLRVFASRIRALSAGSLNIPDITVTTGVSIDTNGFDVSYAGSATTGGIAGLTKTGDGTLTLTGNHTNNNLQTNVFDGTLLINGTFAGNAQVDTNGILGGTGSVGTVTFGAGGTIAPGNSIGTLNVTGDVDFSGGGIYAVEVDDAGNSDLINATGTATLTGGSVSVIPLAGNYNLTTDYTILTAAGGLGGTTFNSVNSTLAFLTPSLTYDANNVFLRLTRNSFGFADVAGTPNQIAVSTLLDKLTASGVTGLDDIINNLSVLTVTGANDAYDSLSGVQHANIQSILQHLNSPFQQLLFDRLFNQNFASLEAPITGVNAGDAVLSGKGVWMKGYGNFGDIDDTTNASGADYNTYGVAFGVDWPISPALTAGLAAGYANTSVDPFNGDADVDSYQIAAYAGWQENQYYVNADVNYGHHSIDSDRQVIVGALAATAQADYDADQFGVNVEGGKVIPLNNNTSITPFAGIDYAHLERDSFTETGAGAANLSVQDQDEDSLKTRIGARLSHTLESSNQTTITPSLAIAYVREHLDSVARVQSGFTAAPNNTFLIDGPDLDRNRVALNAGVTASFSEHSHLNIGYSGEIAESDDHHAISATFRYEW